MARQDRQFDPTRYPHGDLTEQIIAAAIEVHRHLGPGFVESIYENALMHELELRGMTVVRQKRLPVYYKGKLVGQHKADLIVNALVPVELKAVDSVLPVHKAQTLSTVKAAQLQVGLLINFNERVLRTGLTRVVAAECLP